MYSNSNLSKPNIDVVRLSPRGGGSPNSSADFRIRQNDASEVVRNASNYLKLNSEKPIKKSMPPIS
jgi:hypothetical protein